MPVRAGKVALLLLCFLVIVGLVVAVLFFEDGFDKLTGKEADDSLTQAVQEISGSGSISGQLLLERVDAYRKGPVEVATINNIPADIAELLRSQSEHFHEVINAAEVMQGGGLNREQENIWSDIKDSFPPQMYYSRPMRGSYQIGTEEVIEAKHGSSNALPMSHSLYGTIRDLVHKADPQQLDKLIRNLQKRMQEELDLRDPATVKERARDANAVPRAHADRRWLKTLERYLGDLQTAREKIPQGNTGTNPQEHRQHLTAWEKFNRQNRDLLSGWYESQSQSRQQFNAPKLRFVTNGYPVARILFGSHYLYLTPETTPEEIIFTIEP